MSPSPAMAPWTVRARFPISALSFTYFTSLLLSPIRATDTSSAQDSYMYMYAGAYMICRALAFWVGCYIRLKFNYVVSH